MRKVLIFSGSHPRHVFVNRLFLEFEIELSVVMMEREELIPNTPMNLPQKDTENFKRHFYERNITEEKAYGNNTMSQVNNIFSNCNILKTISKNLNSSETINFVRKFKPDFVFIFGCDLIKNPLLDLLPKNSINLHLGLSPWYRGSATLFWPFYNLQPQYAGVTFHRIVSEPDAGDILHQVAPDLIKGQGIHDVGVNCVFEAKKALKKIITKVMNNSALDFHKQNSTGKNYLTSDFRPEHLRLIYNEFDNKIVNYYLSNSNRMKKPNLINLF